MSEYSDRARVDAFMTRLEYMLGQPDDQWFSPEELKGARILIAQQPEISEMVRERAARRIIRRFFYRATISTGAFVGGLVMFQDNLWSVLLSWSGFIRAVVAALSPTGLK